MTGHRARSAVDRRAVLRGALIGTGAVLGGSLWRGLAAGPDTVAAPPVSLADPSLRATALQRAVLPARYAGLQAADANGLQLPAGFTSRVVARSGEKVAGTSYTWHRAPDGGACFPDGTGWIYVSNSEVDDVGGVGALRFDASGKIVDSYRILSDTDRNCAGGPTPWNTWLSCEEVSRGYVYETYPQGGKPAVRLPGLGKFKHEAAAVDPVRTCVYLTEDRSDGCFYRFVPTVWPDLTKGRLEVLCAPSGKGGPVTWERVPDPAARSVSTREQVPAARHFDGGEGCVYADDRVWFSTKGDNRVWELDAATGALDLAYDRALLTGDRPLEGVDNLARSSMGDLLVAEDGDDMEICLITPSGAVVEFLRVVGHSESEITGPAFSPDGTRLYFSSQRGSSGRSRDGITYEVSGPFRT